MISKFCSWIHALTLSQTFYKLMFYSIFQSLYCYTPTLLLKQVFEIKLKKFYCKNLNNLNLRKLKITKLNSHFIDFIFRDILVVKLFFYRYILLYLFFQSFSKYEYFFLFIIGIIMNTINYHCFGYMINSRANYEYITGNMIFCTDSYFVKLQKIILFIMKYLR